MRCSQHLYLASLLSLALGAPAVAQTGPLDARSVRPAVMLLVDTSGSMERVPDDGTNPACSDCVPTCANDPVLDATHKTRWAMTVEALTGTIQDYRCVTENRATYPSTEYDYGYYLPHVNFTQSLTQASDGILDSFANRVKFGLMTFDGVGTTIGGETLVPYTTWGDQSFLDRANGAPGMYSYGRIGRLSFPGCPTDYGVNAGARGPGTHPGAMIRVGSSDNLDDILNVNNQIQSSLLTVRPFGGTPIAAMLDDLKYYIDGSDPDSDLSRTSDPLYECRKRVAILITDGAPDALFRDSRFQCDSTTATNCATNSSDTSSTTGVCQCPYDPADGLAAQLIDPSNALLDQLIVVAYNVTDANALSILNGIGMNGSREPVPGGTPEYPFLVQANGPTELRDKLDGLLNTTQPGVTSRSVPISVNTGDSALSENSKRFDITAGFQVGVNADDPWGGLLFRRRVLCGGSSGVDVQDGTDYDANAGDLFHTSLNNRSPASRRLFTATPSTFGAVNGSLLNSNYSPRAVFDTDGAFDDTPLTLMASPENLRKPGGGTFAASDVPLPDSSVTLSQDLVTSNLTADVSFDTSLNALYFGDANSDGLSGTSADRSLIVDYVRGTSRPGNMLGDIYHSNPVALTPLNMYSRSRFANVNAAYSSWLRKLVANGTGSFYGSDGRPGVVFVGTNDGILHAFNLDDWDDANGTTYPGSYELWGFIPPVLFGKMAAMLGGHQFMFDGTPEVKDVVLQQKAGQEAIFRTVLVSAVRGAPAFVALDVTFPEEPVFMWQTSFAEVGNSVANVGLTQVRLDWNTGEQVRAVAILPGGEGSQAASCPTSGKALVNGETRAEYPTGNARNVRCWNQRGRALYVVDVATGQLIQKFSAEHFPSPLTGSVVVDGAGVGVSTAAYFFDHDGVLWRLSMLSTDPSRWRVSPVYDMFANPATPQVVSPQIAPPDWQLGRRPTYAPSLTRDKTGNLVILAGTGDPDSPMDTARQRVVSLTERRNADATDGEINAEMVLNWQIDLLPNEGVTGPLTVFNDNVYFSTFESQAGADQCALGQSRIYGAHAFQAGNSAGSPPSPEPKLVASGAAPTDPPVLSETLSGSNLLLGLTVKRQPVCQSQNLYYSAPTGQSVPTGPSGGGLYELSAVLSGNSSAGQVRGAGDAGSTAVRDLNMSLSNPNQTRMSSWASAVE